MFSRAAGGMRNIVKELLLLLPLPFQENLKKNGLWMIINSSSRSCWNLKSIWWHQQQLNGNSIRPMLVKGIRNWISGIRRTGFGFLLRPMAVVRVASFTSSCLCNFSSNRNKLQQQQQLRLLLLLRFRKCWLSGITTRNSNNSKRRGERRIRRRKRRRNITPSNSSISRKTINNSSNAKWTRFSYCKMMVFRLYLTVSRPMKLNNGLVGSAAHFVLRYRIFFFYSSFPATLQCCNLTNVH